MKKFFVLSATALMVTAAAFAAHGDKGKGKKKQCSKGKACCEKKATTSSTTKASKTVKL